MVHIYNSLKIAASWNSAPCRLVVTDVSAHQSAVGTDRLQCLAPHV